MKERKKISYLDFGCDEAKKKGNKENNETEIEHMQIYICTHLQLNLTIMKPFYYRTSLDESKKGSTIVLLLPQNVRSDRCYIILNSIHDFRLSVNFTTEDLID